MWPNDGYPAQGYGNYPQGGYPQGGYPQGGYPQGGYPQGGYPQGGYPQGGYPQGGYPQGGYPPQVPAPGFVDPNQGGYDQAPAYGGMGEDGEDKNFDFTEKTVRLGFIRKVYSILMAQLVITFGIVSFFMFHEPTRQWTARNPAIVFVAIGVTFVCIICMACCTSVRRKAPMNYIFLGIFTCAEAFMLGVITGRYTTFEILVALGATAAICLALTLFAFQTKYDFTVMGGILFVGLIILLIFGILMIFFHGKVMTIVYGCLGALLFSFYLIYDTQLMMGGKHKYSISPEEYIFAALNLYLDIVNIFLYILTIIGASRD